MAKHRKPDNDVPQTRQEAEEKLAILQVNAGEVFNQIAKTKNAIYDFQMSEFNERVRLQKMMMTFIPTLHDKQALGDRKIEILFTNKRNSEKRGRANSISSPGFDLAQKLNSQFQELGVTAKLTAGVWDSVGASMRAVDLNSESAESDVKKLSPNLNFDAAAEYIRKESRSGKKEGKNYILVTDDNVYGGGIRDLALTLAYLELDPHATLDFVVSIETGKTALDRLMKELKGKAVGKQVNLVKVSNADEAFDAVKGLIKAHVTAALPPKVEAPKKPAEPGFLKRVGHRALYGQTPMKP